MAARVGRVTFLRVELAALMGEWEECRVGCCGVRRPCWWSILQMLGRGRHAGAICAAETVCDTFKPVAIVLLEARDMFAVVSQCRSRIRVCSGRQIYHSAVGCGKSHIFSRGGRWKVLAMVVYTILHRSCENPTRPDLGKDARGGGLGPSAAKISPTVDGALCSPWFMRLDGPWYFA